MPSQNPQTQQPKWQSTKNIPLIARHVDEMLEYAEDHYLTLQAAKYDHHALDESARCHLLKVYAKRQKSLDVYQQQIERWKTEKLTSIHKSEVLRLEGQLEKLQLVIALILARVR